MVNFFRYCCIKYLICCIFWIFWPAEAKTIRQAAGSRVTLKCHNDSINNLTMVVWNMNGKPLYSLTSKINKTKTNDSVRLGLKISELGSQLYALIIEDAQKSHEGNYTCETTVSSGFFKENWELIITEGNKNIDKLKTAVIAVVPSTCFLILVSVLAILTIRKYRANKNRSPSEIRQQQVEDIYENHFEIQRRQVYLHKP